MIMIFIESNLCFWDYLSRFALLRNYVDSVTNSVVSHAYKLEMDSPTCPEINSSDKLEA